MNNDLKINNLKIKYDISKYFVQHGILSIDMYTFTDSSQIFVIHFRKSNA